MAAMAIVLSALRVQAPCAPRARRAPTAKKQESRRESRVGASRREEETIRGETRLYTVAPYPLLFAATLPGGEVVKSLFGPFVELVKTWNLPDWLVHWGHPGNMVLVLKYKNKKKTFCANCCLGRIYGSYSSILHSNSAERKIPN